MKKQTIEIGRISVDKALIDKGLIKPPFKRIVKVSKQMVNDINDYCIPYDCNQYGKHHNPRTLKPKTVAE